jgi:hypothetical protein
VRSRIIVLRVPAAARCSPCRVLSEMTEIAVQEDIISAQYFILLVSCFHTLEGNYSTVLDTHFESLRTAFRVTCSRAL